MNVDEKIPSAVKDCDIRGRYPEEVNEDLFQRVGEAFGRRIAASEAPDRKTPTVIVGCDDRPSTPALKESFIAGLSVHDLRIRDVGVVPTPVVYWAKERLEARASAVITASHNPPDFNGLKVMLGKRPPTPEMIRSLAEKKEGWIAPGPPRWERMIPWPEALDAYRSEMVGMFQGKGIDTLSIVLDPGTGCQSGIASGVFREMGADVLALHDHLDGRFPERGPDCAVSENLAALTTAVLDSGAHLGVAFDGDGDRIAVVDDQGRILPSEYLGMILMQGPFRLGHGVPVIIDLKCSMHLDELVEQLGGTPMRCKSGHAYMKEMVLEQGAVMGIELSGHVFLGSLNGRDDPLYTALMLSAYLAESGHSLSVLADDLPGMIMTPDLRIPMAEEDIDHIIKTLQQGMEGARLEMLDGVRLVWENGWLLVRKSITEPKITIRWEGETLGDLERIGRVLTQHFHDLSPHVEEALEQEGKKRA